MSMYPRSQYDLNLIPVETWKAKRPGDARNKHGTKHIPSRQKGYGRPSR